MAFNLDKESSSFWKAWPKSGVHARILSEILASDEFHERAATEIVDPKKQVDLIESIVRMTGRRIGQEIARKLGRSEVERDIDSDVGSAFSALKPGVTKELATEISGHKKIKGILAEAQKATKDEVRGSVNELTNMVSRMTGRALGKLLGISLPKILEFGKRILKMIF